MFARLCAIAAVFPALFAKTSTPAEWLKQGEHFEALVESGAVEKERKSSVLSVAAKVGLGWEGWAG